MNYWNKLGKTSKGCLLMLIAGAALVCMIGINARSNRPVAVQPTQAALAVATSVPAVAAVPTAQSTTAAPTVKPTATSVPSETPVPAASDDPEARYAAIAKAGVTIPLTRGSTGSPPGEWKVLYMGEGDIVLTMPIDPGLSNAQSVRQGKRLVSQAVKALFDKAPEMQRVIANGTLPDGPGQSEMAAIKVVVTRQSYQVWDGTAENLGKWEVSIRLR